MLIAIVVLFLIFAVLQGLDGYSTCLGLLISGNKEGNPVMAYLIAHIGTDAAIFSVKILGTAFIGFIVAKFKHSVEMAALLALLDVFYLIVVIHNFSLLKK
jgi:Domain of unknown function (DUF5658)